MNKKRLFAWMILLSALAGLINTISVMDYAGTTVSHVTGLVSKFAISVSTGNIGDCLTVFAVIFAFFLGAVAAGIATGERAFHLRKVYGWIILSIGILLPLSLLLDKQYSTWLFAFLMGLQNGTVVSFRGILVRMTHMTGNLTDFGVYIGYAIRGNKAERPITGMVPAAALFGFTAGGILGILFYTLIGRYVFLAVSGIYILLGLFYFYLQKVCTDKNFNGIPDDSEM